MPEQTSELERQLTIVRFTPAVVGFQRRGSKILLGERKRVSFGLGQGLLAGIGGKIGDCPEFQDETPEQAIDREMEEEIGVRVIEKQGMGRVRFVFAHKEPDSKWNQDVSIFIVSRWDGTPRETESTRPSWYEIDDLPWSRMWADNRLWLPLILSGRRVDAAFLFSDDNTIAEYKFDMVT